MSPDGPLAHYGEARTAAAYMRRVGVGMRADPDDVLQLALIGLWKANINPNPNYSPRVWRWLNMRREVVDGLRRAKLMERRGRPVNIIEFHPPRLLHHTPVPSHESGCRRRVLVEKVLASLPPDGARLVRLVYLEELTPREAAVLLGIGEGDVRKGLRRAMDYLKRRYRR
jgi:RNA polymerase sigma factor (sigma-70 family)